MKVSFDFDNTLTKKEVQDFAKSLLIKGFDVYITTARYDDETFRKIYHRQSNNHKLFEISDEIGIDRSKIIFMNMQSKYDFLNNKNFIWHLDDDWVELNDLTKSDVIGIDVLKKEWKKICKKLLKI